jgi:hypothetical protein
MLALQHGHYRPDQVIRTSVIEPYDIQRYSPVEVARHTIDPFIYGVREPGPAVAPAPSAEAVANAAAAVAESWAGGNAATVSVGGFSVKVTPDTPSPGGLVGQVIAAAHGIRTGRPVVVHSSGTKSVIVQARPGSKVIARGKGVTVKATPGPSAVVRPAAPQASAPGHVTVKAHPGAYPSQYQNLTTAAAQGRSGSMGPVMPGYVPPNLDRRVVPNWFDAGRAAVSQGAQGRGASEGVPAVVSSAASQVASLRRLGI